MHRYKLIIFDFDGTLFATHDAILFCVKRAYTDLNKAIPDHNFIDETIRAGLGMENTLKTLSPELSEQEIQKLLETYETIYLQEGEQKSRPFPEAAQVLSRLFSANFILTVVSNKAVTAVNSTLEYFKLKHYITIVIGDTKTLRKKPDPMAYTRFIQPKFSDIAPQDILVIGDTPADLLFAKNIGAKACWAEYGYGSIKACQALKPTYTIHSLSEVLTILF